jgi:hypothetical protein
VRASARTDNGLAADAGPALRQERTFHGRHYANAFGTVCGTQLRSKSSYSFGNFGGIFLVGVTAACWDDTRRYAQSYVVHTRVQLQPQSDYSSALKLKTGYFVKGASNRGWFDRLRARLRYMKRLGNLDIRSTQTNALKSSINDDIKPNTRHISELLEPSPLAKNRRFVPPVQGDKDRSFGRLGSDLVWRDPGAVKPNIS